MEEFIIAEVIGSWVDMLCSGSGDCGMQGVPYTKALRGIQGSHQDPAAFARATDEAWAAPGAPLLCHTKAASEEHKQPGAGKQGGQTGCGASVRAWCCYLHGSAHREGKGWVILYSGSSRRAFFIKCLCNKETEISKGTLLPLETC